MAQFTYTGDDVRVFPDLSLEVAPGDTVEADENPDPAKFAKAGTKAAKAVVEKSTTEES